MTALQLEAERMRSGRPPVGFYSLPGNRERLEDAARSAGVEVMADPVALAAAVRIAEAGASLAGLDDGLVAVAAAKMTTAQVQQARAHEVEVLEGLDRENADTHARLQERDQAEARKGQARGVVTAAPHPDEAPELKAFAASWADRAQDYGLLATANAKPAAGDVRGAIVRRIAVLGRELEARLRAEPEPAPLGKLRKVVSAARARQGDAAVALEQARLRARLVPCPETHQAVADAALQLNGAASAAAAAAGRAWREWGAA